MECRLLHFGCNDIVYLWVRNKVLRRVFCRLGSFTIEIRFSILNPDVLIYIVGLFSITPSKAWVHASMISDPFPIISVDARVVWYDNTLGKSVRLIRRSGSSTLGMWLAMDQVKLLEHMSNFVPLSFLQDMKLYVRRPVYCNCCSRNHIYFHPDFGCARQEIVKKRD